MPNIFSKVLNILTEGGDWKVSLINFGDIFYVRKKSIIEIHDALVKIYATDIDSIETGMTSIGNLSATINNVMYYVASSKGTRNEKIIEKAAYLMVFLCSGHPFADGNKRTAFVTTIVFLDINGIKLKVDDSRYKDNVDLFRAVASRPMDIETNRKKNLEDLTIWIRRNLVV